MRDLLAELGEEERGIVLGALLGGGGAGLTRVAGAAGERCAAAHRALQEAPRTLRQEVVRRLVQRAVSPLPEGLMRVHSTWVSALLADESEAVVAVILDALPAELRARIGRLPASRPADDVDARLRWIACKRALGALAPMSGDHLPRSARQLLREWPAERLEAAIVQLGTRRSAREQQPAEDRAARRARGLRELAAELPGALARAVAQRLPRELGLPLWHAAGAASDDSRTEVILARLRRADRDARGAR